jgi:hypothetical protein
MFFKLTNFKQKVLCILLLLIHINLYAQNLQEIKISGTYIKTTVISFLNEIEKKYSITFYYKPEWFHNDTINLSFNDTPLNEALQKAVKSKSAVQLLNKSYVFLPNDEIALLNGKGNADEGMESGITIIGNPAEAGKYNKVLIQGVITDGKNDELLIGATLQIENTNFACVTNTQGKYLLSISPGIYNLIISNVGYEKAFQKIKVISNGMLNLELFEEAIKINEIIINAKKADRNVRSSQMSIVEFDRKSIKQLPSLLGEKDIIKSFIMMPGVKSVGEFGSGINIRGGSTDQNLFLIEGAPLFNASHVFGLISVLNPDIVNNVTLYKGHIPSNFGERVSSIMDIQLKDNIPEVWSANGGIGIFSSRLMSEIPIIKQNLSVKIAGRTSYSDWILRRLEDPDLKNSKVGFYDFSSIVTWNHLKNRIAAIAYVSNDDFKYVNYFNYNYKNSLGSVCWNHYASRDLTTTLIYSFSRYQITKDVLSVSNDQSKVFSGINYHGLKFNISTSPLKNHIFDAGINGMYYFINPGKQTPLDTNSVIKTINLQEEKALEGAIYVNDRWEISERLSINAGIRYSSYAKLGSDVTYIYPADRSKMSGIHSDTIKYANNEITQFYNTLEPRLAIKIQLDNSSSVKLSFNRNKQYLSLISNTSVPNPDDFWKLSDRYIKPIDCSHYALGYYKNFNQNNIETSVEVYYKKLKNLVEYKNGATLFLNPEIETALMNADGKNYGVELFVKKNSGKLDGWISYTFSRSLRKTNSIIPQEIINNNQYYPSNYDKPHEITLALTWHLNRRVRFAGNFDYSTGRAISVPGSKYYINGIPVVQFSDRNSYRLPDYHRLDLSFSMDENLRIRRQWKGSWTLSVINVYGHKNIYSVYYVNEIPSAQNNYKNAVLYKLIIIGVPLVSLTYNFIF